ncbi:MAG TPA: type I 3-dehydroquinate dehydratase [Planctomycetes bacterium]|nr:type I 3-dehydroquinate dehydratase [Planctomycetota bacterium]
MATVVSLIADRFEELARAALDGAKLADLVEVRLDRIGHPGRDALARLARELPKPLIVSCHGAEAYGSFAGSLDERLSILRDAAEAGARFVDIDWRNSLELGEVPAPCHRIVSRHERETPDSHAGFDALHAEIEAVLSEGDLTKLVTEAGSCDDGMRMLNWLRTTKGVIAFSSGEAGRFTRRLAPIFGSPFTYCAPAARSGLGPTAPGQIPIDEWLGFVPPGGISQETAIFGVVGNPIGHSLSPRVQGMALKGARLDAVFVAFEPREFAPFFALAQDENLRGLAVTAPFKEDAFAAVERRDEAAERTGAVNTLVRDEHGWRGANTDVPAVRETLAEGLSIHAARGGTGPSALAETRALVLGTGGAARAAIHALRSVGADVSVAGRSAEKARHLAESFGARALPWDAIPETRWDVLVHATPVGTLDLGAETGAAGDPGPVIPEAWIPPGALVLDAVYRPIRTELLLAAHRRGATPIPGAEWFLRQATVQFRLFCGTDPDAELLRKTFEHAHEDDMRLAAGGCP